MLVGNIKYIAKLWCIRFSVIASTILALWEEMPSALIAVLPAEAREYFAIAALISFSILRIVKQRNLEK